MEEVKPKKSAKSVKSVKKKKEKGQTGYSVSEKECTKAQERQSVYTWEGYKSALLGCKRKV